MTYQKSNSYKSHTYKTIGVNSVDKEEIKRRIIRRIDNDDQYAANISKALNAGDEAWLLTLIIEVIGVIIEIGSSIFNWIKRQFS